MALDPTFRVAINLLMSKGTNPYSPVTLPPRDSPSNSIPSIVEEYVDASQAVTGLFDWHLSHLSASYLPFFVERRQIEEQYVASLKKLHQRSRSMDASLEDHRIELSMDALFDDGINVSTSTVRTVWNEIAENVKREAGIHQALLETLDTQVIGPLNTFKEEQERKRNHIRENLEATIAAYNDYRKKSLPPLKRTYLRKSQEAEEYRSALASSSSSFPQGSDSLSPVSQNAQLNRSPSIFTTSTALSDLRDQGKKPSNLLRTFLNRGGSGRDGERSDSVLRYLGAKSEAEEADKEYRRGVHRQETLRLQWMNIVEGGVKSVEAFVRESSSLLKTVLGVYLDDLSVVGRTQSQLCRHGRKMVDMIVPEHDSAPIGANIPRLLSVACPEPILYHNFVVGECKDLIFGTSLVDYVVARSPLEADIPKAVRLCIEDINQRGLEAEGIYWVSGEQAAVQELQYRIERDEAAFALRPTTDVVYSVASFLKAYLRELPEPIFRFPLQERIIHTERIDEHTADNFSVLRSRIRRLPPIHQATLQALVEHLARVVSRSDKNKMDCNNLATAFGPLIFGEEEMPGGSGIRRVQSSKDTLMEDLLTNAHILFSQSGSGSPSSSS